MRGSVMADAVSRANWAALDWAALARDLDRIEAPERAWGRLADDLRALGATHACYHHLGAPIPRGHHANAPFVMQYGFADDFLERYAREERHRYDPVQTAARAAGRAVWWDEIDGMFHLTREQRVHLGEVLDATASRGFSVPLYAHENRSAVLGLVLPWRRAGLPPGTPRLLQGYSQIAHGRLCELIRGTRVSPPALSRRELEVLALIARGKSNAEIARIMDVSPHTVDTHARRIFGKLGVTDRTQASVIGAGLGLIRPGDLMIMPVA